VHRVAQVSFHTCHDNTDTLTGQSHISYRCTKYKVYDVRSMYLASDNRQHINVSGLTFYRNYLSGLQVQMVLHQLTTLLSMRKDVNVFNVNSTVLARHERQHITQSMYRNLRHLVHNSIFKASFVRDVYHTPVCLLTMNWK
jgi:hypothetical protein